MSVLGFDVSNPGFSFDNFKRNKLLKAKGFPVPEATKTGTTIGGIIYKDGVILGADTRATNDLIVSDTNCTKIHFLSANMYCCGAGTAGDIEKTTKMMAAQLELHRLLTNRTLRVAAANQMFKQYLFRYKGWIGAALVLGGVDSTGSHIYCIYPHGSTDALPYCTLGSGSMAAMAVIESRWKPDLEEEEGVKLVRDAISAGIYNDLGSGSNVDICIIRKRSADYIRPYESVNKKGILQCSYRYPKNTSSVLSSRVISINNTSVNST